MQEGGRAGLVNVQLCDDAFTCSLSQTTPVTAVDAFTLDPPTITGFSPATGTTGTVVTITGTGFDPTDEVQFPYATDFAPVNPQSTSTQLKVTVPALALDGPITVITSEGNVVSTQSFDTGWPVPSVSGFTPSSGPVGTTVTITGNNFLNGTGSNTFVYFAGHSAQVNSVSNTQIVAIVPDGAATGLIEVVVAEVQNASGYSNTDFSVVLPSAPTITSVSPASGRVGTFVTINGTNFDTLTLSGNTISFNGVLANVAGVNATQLFTTVPAGATTGSIQVSTSGGSATSSTFTVLPPVTIAGFSPTSGPVGTTVTITGTQFDSNAANDSVIIGNAYANIVSATSTQLVVTVSSSANVGSTNTIQVMSDGSAATSAGTFNITTTSALSITGMSPVSGVVGSIVTVTGTGFETLVSNDNLQFNSVRAQILSLSSTQLVVSVPAGATTGPVQIYLLDTQQSASAPTDFFVLAAGTGTANVAIASVNAEPSVAGQSYTIQVSVTPIAPTSTPTGSVTISDQYTSCIVTLPSTSCALTDAHIGEVTLSARYSGDTVFAGVSSATAEHIVNPASATEMCGLDPWSSVAGSSTYVPLNQITNIVYTPGVAPDIVGDGTLSVTVTSPLAGATVASSSVDVAGTFSGPTNTGIVVNGVLATTENGHFLASGVPLTPGSNTISVTATTLPGLVSTSTLNVTQTSSDPPVISLANITKSGYAPATVTFAITIGTLPNNATLESISLDLDGDGVFDYSASSVSSLPTSFVYSAPGLYNVTLRVVDSAGDTFTAQDFVLIDDLVERRNSLCDIHAYLKQQLLAQNAQTASYAYQPVVQAQYLALFNALGTNMPNASAMVGNVANGFIGVGYAELTLVQDNGDSTMSGFPMTITIGSDGVWRISEM